MKSYSELILLPTFEERFRYLKLGGRVGESTFGFNRYLNQILYGSGEWKTFKRDMSIRDFGCDLAVEGHEIFKGMRPTLHHINPVTIDDVLKRNPCVFDPENVITTTFMTHQAIHYGDEDLLPKPLVERRPYDTCPWR